MISVVIPTISGREESLERCIEGYDASEHEVELIVIRNETTCGLAWGKGAKKAKGDYIHFTADDLVPRPGWDNAAVDTVLEGKIPAAAVYNDGIFLDCPVFLEPFFRNCPNVLVPFLSMEQFELGNWVLPIHYGTDDWVTYQAVRRGITVAPTPAYAFDHYAAEHGRLWLNREVDVPKLCTYMEMAGLVPTEYGRIGSYYGWAGWAG